MDLRHLPPLLLLLLLASGRAAAADPAALWSAQVQPLLDRHCVKCHGPIEKHGGLELDTPAAVLAGGDSGAVVMAGQPDVSPLALNLVAGAESHMPPDKQLTFDEQAIVRAWIDALGNAPPTREASPIGQTAEARPFATVTEAIDDGEVEDSWHALGMGRPIKASGKVIRDSITGQLLLEALVRAARKLELE